MVVFGLILSYSRRKYCTDELDLVVHSTTRQRPLDLFEVERPLLTPLTERPFVGSHEILRTQRPIPGPEG